MSERTESIIALIVCVFILLATILAIPSEGADGIAALFSKYNSKQSDEIAQIVRSTAKDYGVNPNIIASIIVHESGVRPWAVSKGRDYGLMQIRWRVHRKSYPELKSPDALLDVGTNIRIGTEIFARYYVQKKTIKGALLRYSGGNVGLTNRELRTFERLESCFRR